MATVGQPCPDPEVLAAWLDRGLDATESAEIDAHVAGCDDCRVVVAHVLETQSAVHEPVVGRATAHSMGRPVGVARGSTKKLAWGLASVFAAAAMLSLAFDLPLTRWLSGGRSIDSKLADLADAVGKERTIEARLTGGFAYGPLRTAVRSGGSSAVPDNWTLFAAAGRIREEADRDPSAANLHALGLAHLVLGQHDDAVQALEDAVAEEPQNARYQTDLAGAYLARARPSDRPDDLPRALGAAERALKTDEALLEARFNRALALEALFLEDQARQAWQDYLARDSSSEWASEARAHLEKLQQATPPPDFARNDSPPPITDTSVEAALDWLLRHGLARWADAVLSQGADAAAAEHLTLTNYAQRISDVSGDAFANTVASATQVPAVHHARRATILHTLSRGLGHLDVDDIAAAEKDVRAACLSVPHMLASLCDVELGTFDVIHRDHAKAQERIAAATVAADRSGHIYIRGRAARLEGYSRMFQGDYPGALARYAAAVEHFAAAKYGRQVASLSSQLGELHDLLGLPIEAWRWRIRALRTLATSDARGQRYTTRLAAASFLARRGDRAAARAFTEAAGRDPLMKGNGSLQRVMAMVEQANGALADRDVATARMALSDATALVAGAEDFRAARVKPLLSLVEAAVLQQEGHIREADAAATAGIASFGPERAVYKATGFLQRAEIRSQLGEDVAAESDVRDALSLLAARSATPQPIRLDDATRAFQAIASVVLARPSLHTTSGLFLAEQLRELLDGVPQPLRLDTPEAVERAMTADTKSVVIYFLFSNDSLLTWVARGNDIRFIERQVDARAVARRTAILRVQLARSAANEESWRRTLADLYDLVLRDLPGVDAASSLVVVPEGPLSAVPFGALLDSKTGRFVFQRATVRVASNLAFASPSADAPSSTPTASVLAIGEPAIENAASQGFAALAGAHNEAYKVASLYPRATVLVGKSATKPEVLARLSTASVVHFAGHAVANSSDGRSRLLLAGSAAEPRHALTDADLIGRVTRAHVVLAACETASDGGDRAVGTTSIAAAFLRSGAASVVGTLWEVDDLVSEEFFLNVHRALVRGQPASVAVAQAQRECYDSPSCRAAARTWIGTAAYGLE